MSQRNLRPIDRLERVTSAMRGIAALSSPDAHLGPSDRDSLTALLDLLICEMEEAIEETHKAA